MPTLQLSIDTRLQRATENAIYNGMADARTAGYSPTGGSAVAIDPWTGAIKAIASYPTFNQKLAATQPELPRAPLPRHDRHPDAQPRDLRRVSDRLDVQADHRGGRPRRRDHHAVHAAALLRLVRARQPHVLQCRARRVRDDGSADGARAVVRHVVLPARRPDLGGRSGEEGDAHPALGAHARARDEAADRPHRRDVRLPPATRTRYFERLTGTPYYEGQAINLAIGQGALQVSPLQLAVAYSALINGGTVVRPHVAEAVIRNGVRHKLRFKPVRKLHALAVDVGDQAGALRGGEQPVRHVGRGVRRLHADGGGQDGHRAGAAPRRPLVVRVVGAVRPPEARRRRDDRARRLRRQRRRAGREADLSRRTSTRRRAR